jgi:hypothetical protein
MDPPEAVFSLTASPPNVAGSTHFLPMILDSSRHVALFVIADRTLHEPHPVFQKFESICGPYRSSLRPVILALAYRIGGLRKPNWSSDDILFLATNNAEAEKAYGLNGKDEMDVIIVRPDGYIAYSTPIDNSGTNLDSITHWLQTSLVKG